MTDGRLTEKSRVIVDVAETDGLGFDFGDGVSALDRTMRAITMIVDGAIQRLLSLGWRRRSVKLEIAESDPLPCWIALRGRRVYEVRLVKYDDGRIAVQGEWIGAIRSPGIIERLLGR